MFVCSASGGELQMLLDKDEVPEERQVKRLMHQILDGLVFLHSINVAHLDIKVRHWWWPTLEYRDIGGITGIFSRFLNERNSV